MSFLRCDCKPIKKWSDEPKIENLLLIHLLIYKKIFFLGLPNHFLIGLQSHRKKPKNFLTPMTPSKNASPTPNPEPLGQKYSAQLIPPMSGSNHPSFVKIRYFRISLYFWPMCRSSVKRINRVNHDRNEGKITDIYSHTHFIKKKVRESNIFH